MPRAKKAARRPLQPAVKLDDIISAAPIVLFATDKNGVVTLSTGKGLEGLGLKPGDHVGLSLYELYKHNPRICANIKKVLAGKEFTDVVTEKGRVFETRYTPRKARGKVVGMVGVAADVTDHHRVLELEKKARAHAEASSQAKDEFLAVVSHELRTPMTAIQGWTWLLRSGEVKPQDVDKALEVIERNMKLQAQIIEDLLDISTIVTGKLQLNRTPFDVNAALDDALEQLRPSAEAREIKLEEDRVPVIVHGDRARLRQIFWNLLSNAIKFNREGGVVRLIVGKKNGDVLIRFEDTGEGIPSDFLPSLFNPLKQAESSLTRKHRGLGIGLAIVRHLVKMHGGTVEAYSEGPGKGSRFMITLPSAEKVGDSDTPIPASETEEAALPHSLDLMRILIVDDEPDTLSILAQLLRYCGADVSTASDAKQALALVPKFKPDIVISDIAMPMEDGYTLIRKIRALGPSQGGEVPALALTAMASQNDRRLALEAGFQFYLAKPVEPAKLVAALRSLPRRQRP
jgi:signal transduction histidine kinase/ActR/RegA family two-component response regulator